MTIAIKNMEDLAANSKYLPTAALVDINQRIGDWMESGGNIEDGYIHQQFRYAENILKIRRTRHD